LLESLCREPPDDSYVNMVDGNVMALEEVPLAGNTDETLN